MSDISDDSESESIKIGNEDALTTAGQLTVFDESVLPEGCDPKLFALTFELRSQRHKIEQSIENIKKQMELSNKNLCLANTELDIIENGLKQNIDELEAYRVSEVLFI